MAAVKALILEQAWKASTEEPPKNAVAYLVNDPQPYVAIECKAQEYPYITLDRDGLLALLDLLPENKK